ncbi:MAG TPA: hypothetical protein VEJ40_04340 [Pseudolabrys sp.]|nr:hypothetical protein [Pseudolabrys sp.]
MSDQDIKEFPGPVGSSGQAQQRPQATLRYVDRPELGEIFADSITNLAFDGQSLRLEFGITRMDEVKPNTPMTGRRYPAARLVLPPGAAVELINRMQQIASALTQAGVLRQNPTATPTAAAKPVRN